MGITQHINNTHEYTTTNRHLENIQKHEKVPRNKRKEWCNPKIKRMIKKQHELYENRIKNPTKENIKKHTTYRNKIKKTIQQIKRKHITEQLEQTKNDPKQQAKVLNNILSINNNTKTTPTILR